MHIEKVTQLIATVAGCSGCVVLRRERGRRGYVRPCSTAKRVAEVREFTPSLL